MFQKLELLCSNIHIQSNVVHKLLDFDDAALQVIISAL